MGIYIKGMEMPSIGYREIRIYPDGRVIEEDECGWDEVVGTAEQVQSHGRLIDAHALFEEVYKVWGTEMSIINEAPTIIPAEEGE